MKKLFFVLLCAASVAAVSAAEYSYVWGEVYPNYKSQIPSSDFVTPDGVFRFTSDKADGTSGPQFSEDSKAGLLYRLYADNTLRIECLAGAQITAITFVIGGNGHYKLAQLTPSSGAMQDPYLGKDETDTFKEYRLFWAGNTADVTFTVGHECACGTDCDDPEKGTSPGTCMTKQMILTTTAPEALEEVSNDHGSADRQKSQMTTALPIDRNGKYLKNGHLLIEHNGRTFTAQGVEVR